MTGISKSCILEWIGAKPSKPLCSDHFSTVAVDSRLVEKGSIFFALKGATTDGHNFLRDVEKKEALCAVVEKDFQGENLSIPLFRVEDPLAVLQNIAKKWLAKFQPKIVAITGSIGKTTTRAFLTQILEKKYRVSTASGNKNSQIGLPLYILNETAGDEEVIVVEMGMTGYGQIQKLVSIAPPDIALLTMIAHVHAGLFQDFKGLEDIARAKCEIFSHPKTKLAIINRNSDCFEKIVGALSCKSLNYSFEGHTDTDYFMEEGPDGFFIKEKGALHHIRLAKLAARHLYSNLLGAISVARALSISYCEMAESLSHLTLPAMRLEIVEKKGITFINDCYNAAEPSVKGALQVLMDMKTQGKKVAVLGFMPDLGPDSDSIHERVGVFAHDKADLFFCIGKAAGPLVEAIKSRNKSVEWFDDFDALFMQLQLKLNPGDTCLVKGARSLKLERIVEQF